MFCWTSRVSNYRNHQSSYLRVTSVSFSRAFSSGLREENNINTNKSWTGIRTRTRLHKMKNNNYFIQAADGEHGGRPTSTKQKVSSFHGGSVLLKTSSCVPGHV